MWPYQAWQDAMMSHIRNAEEYLEDDSILYLTSIVNCCHLFLQHIIVSMNKNKTQETAFGWWLIDALDGNSGD